jgi:hypothetical protein
VDFSVSYSEQYTACHYADGCSLALGAKIAHVQGRADMIADMDTLCPTTLACGATDERSHFVCSCADDERGKLPPIAEVQASCEERRQRLLHPKTPEPGHLHE